MSTIKTNIDGVPVELEIVKASNEDSTETISDILSRDVEVSDGNGGSKFKPIVSCDNKIRVVSVGNKEVPASNIDIQNVNNKIISSNAEEIINSISEAIQNLNGKPWWTSKTIWVNIITVVVSITAYFGFDLKSHGIDANALIAMIPTILGLVNIVLRMQTTKPLEKDILP